MSQLVAKATMCGVASSVILAKLTGVVESRNSHLLDANRNRLLQTRWRRSWAEWLVVVSVW